jgi:hypothetical protein
MPFDVDGQIAVSEKIADRLTTQASSNLQPVYPADAVYLRQAVIQWLVGQMVQVNSNSYLIDSLTTNYGVQTIGQLLRAFRPDSNIGLLAQVTQKSLEQTGLDWRDYLTWRLALEDELLSKRDEGNFLALYDTRDIAVRDLAYTRFNAVEAAIKKTVTSVRMEVGNDASVSLRTMVEIGEGTTLQQSEVVFRLADGVWKRVN